MFPTGGISLKALLAASVVLCVVSAEKDTPFCLNANDGTRLCSAFDVPNGETYTDLLQSIMAIPVDRKGLIQVTPSKYNEPVPAAEGPLSPNKKLDENTTFHFDFLSGPESIYKVDNTLYAAANNGIYKVDLKTGDFKIIFDGNANCRYEKSCSRPLGIRVNGSRLLCADGLQGLIEVNLETGESKVHLAVGTLVNDKPLLFPDDIDVNWEKEIVYMSDGSTKWSLDYWIMAVLESDASSRIIRFDLKTGKADVFAQNLRFANGVQISHDKKFLLVDEFSARRVLKFPLEGSVPATGRPFTGLLPGNPDNIRPSLTGGYWVALAITRFNGSRTLLDDLQARPDLAKKFGNSVLTIGGIADSLGTLLSNTQLQVLGTQVNTGMILLRSMPRVGIVLELDADGNILQSLQSMQTDFLTEALEFEDGLYLGSFVNKFVLKVPKTNFRNP